LKIFAELSVDMMNTALRYGQAGEEIIDDVEKEFQMPDADAKSKQKGMEREQFIFQHSESNKLTESGRMQYEQALKMHFEGIRHYNKHRGELSWYLLDCLSPQLPTRVRAHTEFERARRERNSFRIWQITKFCCTAEGELSHGGYYSTISTQTRQRCLDISPGIQDNNNKDSEEATRGQGVD
jgi:hypothetical protein